MQEDGENEGALLQQLDRILSAEPFIDEVGFVHPTQLASLHESISPSCINHAEIPAAHPSSFWCADHKLAISTEAVAPLYRAAKSVFITTRAEYQSLFSKYHGNHSSESESTQDDVECGSAEDDIVEIRRLAKKLLSHTRAVVVLNSGYKTAWDVRKQIFKNLSMVVPLEELQLSSLALSFNPKSEDAWAHRRWTIRSRVECGHMPDHLLEEESRLIAIIADRSRMNYRAWRHCGWLVSWMSPSQVLQELQRWRKWAQLHVADNCCFHFRRCLLQRLLMEDKLLEVKDAWLDEIEWNKGLIEEYIGREALWVHRRFLFVTWVRYLKQKDGCCYPRQGVLTEKKEQDQDFLKAEIMFANACIASCSDDDSEDGQRHLVYASTFKLWVLLKWKETLTSLSISQVWCKEIRDAEQLLQLKAPLHRGLWEDLLKNYSAEPDETLCSEEYVSCEKIKQPS